MHLKRVEKEVVAAYRKEGKKAFASMSPDSAEAWLFFGILTLLKIGITDRGERLSAMSSNVSFKEDNSPVTNTDCTIESFFALELKRFCSNATLLGEESGGSLPDEGYGVAIDPIDGTWSFLNRLETISTSLVFTKDQKPFLGMIFNPVTGELVYGGTEISARILQFDMFGEGDSGFNLPLENTTPESLLINLQPQRNAFQLMQLLYDQWEVGNIKMVRSSGGSPSHALLDAAKGSSAYINIWSKQKAAPYDLAAGIVIIRAAGGDVVDLQGNPVVWDLHKGPFLAATDIEKHFKLLQLFREVINW